MFDPQKYREEKEKEIRAVYGNLRKRSFKFLFLNVLMVISIFAFIFFVQRVSPQTYSNIVENLQLIVELSKVEFKAPEKVSARVYLVNTKKTKKMFVISEFYIKVYSQDKTIYEFTYSSPVQGSVERLSKKLVYDLSKEVTLSNLPTGNYSIYVKCKINGKDAQINRTFAYAEEISYDIIIEPFYLIGEAIKPSLMIINRTSKSEKIQIDRIVWKCKDRLYTQRVKDNIYIYPGEGQLVNSGFGFPVVENKNMEIGATVYLKDGTIKDLRVMAPVTKSSEKSAKGLDFSIEAEEPVIINQTPKLSVFIINQQNNPRFLNVDKITFDIPKLGYNFEIGNRRVFLQSFGKTFITKLERLKFTEPGVYDLLITISADGSKYQKKLTIAVGR